MNKADKLELKMQKMEEKKKKAESRETQKAEMAAVRKKNKEERTRRGKRSAGKNISSIDEGGDYIFDEKNNNIKDVIASNGVNPNPLEYMVIGDGGHKVYVMCFYIHKLPNRSGFADTFSSLFNYPGVTSNVSINPMTRGKASKQLDKRIESLESEEIAADKGGETNRFRRMSAKKANAEKWAENVESGENALYEVQFLFALNDTSLDGLNKRASDFYSRAREKGIDIMSCYSVHPEAYLSASPLNKVFNLTCGIAKGRVAKKHVMDRKSLATIFNHTRSSFTHKNGVVAGYNLHTGLPVLFDVYDASHNGFGVIICGKTGTGKSALIKMLGTRYIDFGFRIISIDYDSVGTLGEYAQMAYAVGGAAYQMKPKSTNIINLFEIEPEMEYDEITGTEYEVLDLIAKIADLKHIIMTMVKSGKEFSDAADMVFLEDVITDIISELYDERGIKDGEPDSLYETGTVFTNGMISSGRVKKLRPTVHDFFIKALHMQKENNVPLYERTFAILIAAMKKYVREVYICRDTLKEFSREEFEKLPSENGRKVYTDPEGRKSLVAVIKGTAPYFDGQSTIDVSADIPMLDIDLSQLPKGDKPVAQTVAMNYLNENFIKRNSVNPKKVQNMIFIVDEAHRMFPYPEARAFIGDTYRTARKKHVSPWTVTQALADFKTYEDTKAMVKNATSKFLLKQDYQDKAYIAEATPLTEGQIEELLSLGGDPNDKEASDARKGEVCLIDNEKVCFIKMHYLKNTEAQIVETDAVNRQKIYASLANRQEGA